MRQGSKTWGSRSQVPVGPKTMNPTWTPKIEVAAVRTEGNASAPASHIEAPATVHTAIKVARHQVQHRACRAPRSRARRARDPHGIASAAEEVAQRLEHRGRRLRAHYFAIGTGPMAPSKMTRS